jgi:membrane protein
MAKQVIKAPFFRSLTRAAVILYHSRSLSIAKGAAYSALLAFFPVLATLAVLLVRFRARAVSQVMARILGQLVPPGSEELVVRQFAVTGQRPLGVLIFAGLVTVYAASGIVLSLIEGCDLIYRVPKGRSFFHQRGVAAVLVVAAALPAVGASALILLGDRTERSVLGLMTGHSPGQSLADGVLFLGRIGRLGVTLAASIASAGVLLRYAANRATTWREVWPGAWLVTGLWLVATYGFRYYVANISSYNVLYGSVATAIALVVWLYLLALIMLYGAAFNAARRGGRYKS